MSDPLAIPLILEAKRILPGHVVVGKLTTQVDFIRELLGGARVELQECTTVTDTSLLERLGDPRPFVYLLPNLRALNVADDVRRRIHVWAALPIRKRTAAIRALVRAAVDTLGLKDVPNEQIDVVGDRVVDQLGEEAPLSSMVWLACWLLTDTGPVPDKEKFWANPWDKPWGWCPAGVSMAHRLNALYKVLVAWTFARDNHRAATDAMGYSPAAYRWLQSERIAPSRVDAAIQVLSAWRSRPDAGYTAALQIGTIFAA